MTEARRLPYQVREAFIAVCGKGFGSKPALAAMFMDSGVAEEIAGMHADKSMFKMAGSVLAELDSLGEEGWRLQGRLVSGMCRLKSFTGVTEKNREVALAALKELKRVALEYGLISKSDAGDSMVKRLHTKKGLLKSPGGRKV
ncbi:MAG TPA: hypothetical protein VGB23_08795 [Nitrospirota bacterium]|jgi:hypothetical protein